MLKQYWGILKTDPDLKDISLHYPQVTYRRGRSLRDRLVHSHYTPIKKTGTWLDRKPVGTVLSDVGRITSRAHKYVRVKYLPALPQGRNMHKGTSLIAKPQCLPMHLQVLP